MRKASSGFYISWLRLWVYLGKPGRLALPNRPMVALLTATVGVGQGTEVTIVKQDSDPSYESPALLCSLPATLALWAEG